MAGSRGEFSSRLGFILTAAGSAIGLGNVWGFPGQTAANGGAAFVLVYLILSFVIAYPALMAEFTIGRYSRSNIVGAFTKIEGGKKFSIVGYLGLFCGVLILSFYSIVGGWMISYVFEVIFKLFGMQEAATWAISKAPSANVVFTVIFSLLTIGIVLGGVKNGIEKWATRLMPVLIGMLVLLIIYVMTLDGASKGLSVYLVPDFSKIFDKQLIISALGQSFFSMSLGVGSMLVYGSYIRKQENLASTGALVTLADLIIAFLAGLLIIPAMYVAEANGVQIYDAAGKLIADSNIAFQVLPPLFETLGAFGTTVAFIFFLLMTIAAVTSSISLLEIPVAHMVDDKNMERKKASWISGIAILCVSLLIISNFGALFGLVITIATQYLEPIVGLSLCIFIGWVMNRNSILNELKEGYPEVENSLFYKIWPIFVRFVCPALIIIIFINTTF